MAHLAGATNRSYKAPFKKPRKLGVLGNARRLQSSLAAPFFPIYFAKAASMLTSVAVSV
jgi:hypothetical protein